MTSTELHCLILSPEGSSIELLEASLQKQFNGSRITIAFSVRDAVSEVESSHFDLVLLVLDPLQENHRQLFSTLKEKPISMPTILVARDEDRDRLLEMLDGHDGCHEITDLRGLTENSIGHSIRKAIQNHESRWELEHVKKAFQSSLIQYRSLFDELPDMVFLCDRSGCLLDINETAVQLFGMPREKMLLRPIFEVFGLQREDFDILLSRALAREGRIEDFEIEYRPGGREAVYGMTHLVHYPGTDKNRPMQFQGVIRDITPHKIMERQLRESEDQYRTLYQLSRICSSSLRMADVIDQSLDMIHRCFHAKGSMLMMNKCYEELNLLKEIGMPETLRQRYDLEPVPILGQDLIGRMAISSGIQQFTPPDTGNLHPVLEEWLSECPGCSLLGVSMGRGNPTLPSSLVLLILDTPSICEPTLGLFDGLSKTLEMGITNCLHYANSREAEERYRDLWDDAPAYFISLLKGGTIFEINQTAAGALGYEVRDLIGNSIQRLIEPDDFRMFQRHHDQLMTTGKSQDYELRMVRKNGEKIIVSVRSDPLKDRDGSIIGEKSVLYDITRDKEMEERLRDYADNLELKVNERTAELNQTMNFLNGILDGSTEYAIIGLDENGGFLNFNRGAQLMFGYRPDELVNISRLDLLINLEHSPWEDLDGLIESARKQEVLVAETAMLTSDQRHLVGLLSMNRLSEPAENNLAYVVIIRNITEQKEMEELLKHYNDNLHLVIEEKTRELEHKQVQLIQSGKLATLGEMATGIAHELNQPLSGIRTRAQFVTKLIERGKFKPDSIDQKQKEIVSLIDRISKIIDHMRIFARQANRHHAPFSINDSIEGALSLIGEQMRTHAINLTLEIPDDLPKVYGESLQIEQVILNLMSNARDALDARVEMESSGPEDRKRFTRELNIRAFCTEETHEIILEIEDNGMGMDEETRSRIFDPFFTTKEVGRGTGLGLSISYGIITDHHGRVDVESEEGLGTTFKISLPACPDDSPEANIISIEEAAEES
jgi:PAS domain S-box-containing protein